MHGTLRSRAHGLSAAKPSAQAGRARRLTTFFGIAAAFALMMSASASASVTSGFEANSYPVSISGEGPSSVTIPGIGALECSGNKFQSSLNGPSESLTTSHVEDGSCSAFGSPEPVKINGCNLSLRPEPVKGGSGLEKGTLEVGPPGCGPIVFNLSAKPCAEVSPQTASYAAYELKNTKSETVELQTSIHLNATFSHTCGTGSGEITWNQFYTLTARNAVEKQIGLRFSKELKLAPAIEAESYPATLSGGGLGKFSLKPGTFECTTTGLQATLTKSSSSLGSLSATYAGCEANVGSKLTAAVEMNSCHYTLDVKNAGPPYSGTWGVGCTTSGDGIEFKVFVLGKFRKCATVSAQSGLGGVSLSNVGSWSERGIGIKAEVTGVKYEITGGSCGTIGEVRSDGVFSGEPVLHGANEAKKQLGVYLVGVEA